ncbi:MAG TPA: glycosyltransferase [Thermoanaerobaculia bacterium]|nr:glycosyltransferase [Thermoanaerobaculia bacterium]
MRPYNIAIIAGQLVVGGAERQLYLWLANLDRDRFNPVVVTLHPDCGDYWEAPIRSLGVPLLPISRRKNPLGRLLEITRVLRPYKPHLIHGWHSFASPYAGAAAMLLGARASLGSLRGSFDAYTRHRAQSVLTEWLTDGILVNSESAAIRLARSGRRRGHRIYTVPNAVEDRTEERARARANLAAKYSINPERIWVGSTGRFESSKRFDLLLDALASLRGRNENVQLVLIGYGEGMETLRSRAESLGVADRVTFTGEDAGARLWIGALDIFCFLSEDEGLPNAVMEAAAAGVPVVAWRTSFLEELLENGRSAILVPAGDLGALDAALRTLIHEPHTRHELGRVGRTHVLENFSVGRFVQGITSTYEELLTGFSG